MRRQCCIEVYIDTFDDSISKIEAKFCLVLKVACSSKFTKYNKSNDLNKHYLFPKGKMPRLWKDFNIT